jgi:MEMO1 family protein
MDHLEKPRIRPVEAFPVEQNGTTFVCMRDPSGLAPETIMLGIGAYFIATRLSGENNLRDVQAAFLQRFGELIPLEKIKELVDALDKNYFLFSPAFAERETALREAFLKSPERAAHLAGFCYETDPAKVREELAAYFDPPEGPGRAPARKRDGSLAGLVAPHIDPRRGRAAYAHAYGELIAHEPPELVVILGTSHYGSGPELFTATRKGYATPLGTVETDREFTGRLAERYRGGGDLFAQEVLHRDEHSIEFQALFLAWALGTRGYQIVPVLVSSFHELVEAGEMPGNNPRVRSFVDALGGMLAAERRRVLIIAGVDLAHVGRKFGDSFAADRAVAERVQREDLELIEDIKRGDPEGLFADVARDRDARRICGLAPLYTQLALGRGRRGRLLKYGIAMEPDTGSAVSFASLAIE